MRFTDVMLALPKLLVGLVIAIVIGPSYGNLILVLGLLTWPRIARLVRGDSLAVRQTEYVRYSMAIGVLKPLVCAKHVVPNILSTLLVATTLEVGSVILTEASLSFLGAGIPSPQPSWGTMIADGQGMMATGWWISLFPGLCIGAVVISCNTLGDWLRDKYDPRTKGHVMSIESPVLEVEDLHVSVARPNGDRAMVVRGVSFAIDAGNRVGLVGESGSGKTMTSLAIMGLLPVGAYVESGSVRLEGQDLLSLNARQLQRTAWITDGHGAAGRR